MLNRKNATLSELLASDLGTAVPPAELETLERMATTLSIPAGEQIVRMDGFGRECFVVVDGEFKVERDDLNVVVGPGNFIGELALLTLKPRTASVTATTDSTVFVMNRAEFSSMLDACPGIARFVLDGAVRRSAA